MVEIRNQKEAEAWLETQDHQTQVWMAARAALRALPALEHDAEAHLKDQLTLASFRAHLISSAAATCPSLAVGSLLASSKEAHSAVSATVFLRHAAAGAASASELAVQAAGCSAGCVFRQKEDGGTTLEFASGAIANLTSSRDTLRLIVDQRKLADEFVAMHAAAVSAVYAGFSKDAERLGFGWPRLWQIDTTPVADLLALWPPLKKRLEDDPDWKFWADWYQSLLDGDPPQKLWDLTQRIALEITEDEWDWDNGKGPAKVAAKIEQIQLAYELKARIVDYEARLKDLLLQPIYSGNRDNGGPPLQDLKAITQESELIRVQLGLIKDELEKLKDPEQEADLSVFRKAGEALWEILDSLGGYTIVLVDLAAKGAATNIGKASGVAIVAEFSAPGSLKAIVDAAIRLGGG